MNREAAGLGSWLLRDSLRPVSASLDAQAAHALDQQSFMRWQAEAYGLDDADPAYEALLALLREIWRDELDGGERAVLRGLHLEGKSEAALGREMGLHHSAVGRLRRRAEGKLRGGLDYALRYKALMGKQQKRDFITGQNKAKKGRGGA